MKSIVIWTENRMSPIDSEEFIKIRRVFYQNFVEKDGFSLLCNILENLDVQYALKDVVWISIFLMLVDFLRSMLEDEDFINTIKEMGKEYVINNSTIKVLKVCTNILMVVSKDVKLDRDLRKCLLSPDELEYLPTQKVDNITEQYRLHEIHFFRYLIGCLKN